MRVRASAQVGARREGVWSRSVTFRIQRRWKKMVLCMGLEALDLHIALHIRDARGLGPPAIACFAMRVRGRPRHNVQHAAVATVAPWDRRAWAALRSSASRLMACESAEGR
jgi:hypothetical protein